MNRKNRKIFHLLSVSVIALAAHSSIASPLTPATAGHVLSRYANLDGFALEIRTDGASLFGYACRLNTQNSVASLVLERNGRAVAGTRAARVNLQSPCPNKAISGFYLPASEAALNASLTPGRWSLTVTDEASAKRVVLPIDLEPVVGPAVLVSQRPNILRSVQPNTVVSQSSVALSGTYCRGVSEPRLRLTPSGGVPLAPSRVWALTKNTRCPAGSAEMGYEYTQGAVNQWLRSQGAVAGDKLWLWHERSGVALGVAAPYATLPATWNSNFRRAKWIDLKTSPEELRFNPFDSELNVGIFFGVSTFEQGRRQALAVQQKLSTGQREAWALIAFPNQIFNLEKRLLPQAVTNFEEFMRG